MPASRSSLLLPLALLALGTSAHADFRTLEASPDQDRALDTVLSAARPGTVVVFDLDSTLIDNRMRQTAILRAWASREGIPQLEGLWPEHFQEWNLESALRRAGAPDAHHLARRAKEVWRTEFWSDDALRFDLAIPGAARYVRAVHQRGATVLYVGRRDTQQEGTLETLARLGFPVDERAHLLCDHVEGGGRDEGDQAWQATLATANEFGIVVGAFENEGPRADLLRARWPEAHVVYVRTDGPGPPKAPGLVVQGFLRTTDQRPHPGLADAVPSPDTPLSVIDVADGDTVTVQDPDGKHFVLRLIGVDTPEKDPLYDMPYMQDKKRRHIAAYGERLVEDRSAWKLGKQALIEMLKDRTVFLRYDQANAKSGHRDRTSSRRVLAYLFARGADGSEVDVNAELCRGGFTYDYAHRYPHRRAEEFRKLIEEARKAGRGYWSAKYQPL